MFITHLLFVHDIFLYFNGYRRDAHKIKQIMDLYYLEMGMVANMDKSTIFFIGVNGDKRGCLHLLPFMEVGLD